jgi:hypothetical protein
MKINKRKQGNWITVDRVPENIQQLIEYKEKVVLYI